MAVDASGDPITSRGALVGEWTLSAWDVVQENPDATPEEVADLVEDWMPSGEEPYGKAAWPLSLGLAAPGDRRRARVPSGVAGGPRPRS